MKTRILEELMMFSLVVEHKSFAEVARRLNLSNSTVSKQVDRLEASLKTRLLHRTTRTLTLTEAGEQLYYHCQQLQGQLHQAAESIQNLQNTISGSLRLHSPLSFGVQHLVPCIDLFMREHPDIEVDLSLGGNVTNLIENRLDIAIHVGQPPISNMIAKKLATLSMAVCASPAYLKEHGTPEKPDDLEKHNCLIYQEYPHHGTWRFLNKPGTKKANREMTMEVSGKFHAASSQALKAAAIAGTGICMLPEFMLTQEIKSGKLTSILEPYCPHDIVVYALYPHRKRIAQKVRHFINFMTERFSEDKYWH